MSKNPFSSMKSTDNVTSPEEVVKRIGADDVFEKVMLKYGLTMTDKEGEESWVNKIAYMDRAVVNTRTGDYVGIVGHNYGIVPYVDVVKLIWPLIEAGEAKIVRGSCPNRGERMYLLLEAPGSINLGPKDMIVNRFVVTAGHDGKNKIVIRMCPFREKNGTASITETKPLSFKHSRKSADRIAQARKTLKGVKYTWDTYEKDVQDLLKLSISDEDVRMYFETVIEGDSTQAENTQAKLYDIFKTSKTIGAVPHLKGTLFGATQAVVEWVDHYKTVRKSDIRDEVSASLDAQLISDGAKKKALSWGFALKLRDNFELKGVLK